VERDAFTEKLTAALDQFIIDYGAYRQRMTSKLQVNDKVSHSRE
jgi:hypothetical protein